MISEMLEQGSFEKIQELSLEGTLPTDYVQTAHSHALDGCYVLGLGYRSDDGRLCSPDALVTWCLSC
jgi:hypothetical protein